MNLIEIPFTPRASHDWISPLLGNAEKQFHSREQALAFAQTLAECDSSDSDRNSCLCVEGADGRWRLFTPDVLPVKEPC
ncbi:MAG: hypothetical protein ABI247_13950 [Rhodanobacter sp.]